MASDWDGKRDSLDAGPAFGLGLGRPHHFCPLWPVTDKSGGQRCYPSSLQPKLNLPDVLVTGVRPAPAPIGKKFGFVVPRNSMAGVRRDEAIQLVTENLGESLIRLRDLLFRILGALDEIFRWDAGYLCTSTRECVGG